MGRIKDTYVPVNVRVMTAREEHKTNLSITTELNLIPQTDEGTQVHSAIVKATVALNKEVLSTGHAFCLDITEEKALEKAETVAVGRALALAGYEADSAIASAEEMEDIADTSSTETEKVTSTTLTKGPRLGFGNRSK